MKLAIQKRETKSLSEIKKERKKEIESGCIQTDIGWLKYWRHRNTDLFCLESPHFGADVLLDLNFLVGDGEKHFRLLFRSQDGVVDLTVADAQILQDLLNAPVFLLDLENLQGC